MLPLAMSSGGLLMTVLVILAILALVIFILGRRGPRV